VEVNLLLVANTAAEAERLLAALTKHEKQLGPLQDPRIPA
jgi:hypothetical protein